MHTAGWKRTFHGYYVEQVHGILDSVLVALAADPSRRFVWSEVSYFARWYDALDAARRTLFRKVLDSGQFEFVGAWRLYAREEPQLPPTPPPAP